MSLFHFAETANDDQLHKWYDVGVTTPGQFAFVHDMGASRPILYEQEKLDNGYRNNCSDDEARMFFMFVALATGEGENPNE